MKLSIRNFLTKLLKSKNLVSQIYTVLNSRLNVVGRLKILAVKRVDDGIMEIYRVYIPSISCLCQLEPPSLSVRSYCYVCAFQNYSAVGVTEFVESWEKVCEMFLKSTSTYSGCTQVYLYCTLSIITLLVYNILL